MSLKSSSIECTLVNSISMKVIPANKKIGYPDDFRHYLNFKRFEKKAGDFVFVEGVFEQNHQWEQFNFSKKYLESLLKKRVVRLEIEEPNKFCIPDNPEHYDHYFDTIYTICPYTAEWLNKKNGVKKRIPIFYPTNEKYIPKKTKKIYDIVFIGNLVSGKLLKDVETISKYNYKWVSFSKHPLVTDTGVTYRDKLKILSQSKIAIVHNILMPKPYHIVNIWQTPGWYNNKAFRLVPKWYEFWKIFTDKNILIPQTKTRLFETALSRTLILCKKDPFNLIEKFFEPNREFIYYTDASLASTINKILANYDKYQVIADRAYKRARKEYTTKAFVKKYLSKL